MADLPAETANTRPAKIAPFKDPAIAREAGRKSGEIRRARKAADLAKRQRADKSLTMLIGEYEHHNISDTARAVMLDIMARIVTTDEDTRIPVRNGAEASALLDQLNTIRRLENGEATSHTMTLSGTIEQVTEAIRRAQEGSSSGPGNVL